MKWKSHVEIANAVADQLGLPPELKEILRQGSIQPDREGDKVIVRDHRMLLRRRRVRHHRPSKRFIRGLLWKARTAYIEGREEDAVWCLGRALHYVQDRSVATGPLHLFHDAREAKLGQVHFQPNAIRLGAEASVPSPIFIDLCLQQLTPKRSAIAAMHQACMLSSALANTVLSGSSPGKGLIVELKRAEGMRWPTLLALMSVLALAVSSTGIWLGQPLFVAASLPLASLILIQTSRLHGLRAEARWFVRSDA